jgi:ubiquinone/menaquinone biosynthesis C-methylase UbiE
LLGRTDLREKKSKIRELNDEHAMVYDVITIFPFYRNHLKQIITGLEPARDKLYLDLGCGTGNLLEIAQDTEVLFIGVDFSSEMLKRAKKKGKNLVMADLHYLPFRNSCIDGITNVNVFYQLDHPEIFLKEVYRVLKPGGKIIISTPRRGGSLFSFVPRLIKTVIRHPGILTNVGKIKELTAYSKINRNTVDMNPAFYDKEELEEMLADFEVQSIKKAYEGQNWLISASKPAK